MQLTRTILAMTLLVFLQSICFSHSMQEGRDIYQIKIYYLDNEDQDNVVNDYLKQAYLPALERLGIRDVGVFRTIEDKDSTQSAIYVLVPFQDPGHIFEIDKKLEKDEAYLKAGDSYINATYDNPPYDRIETILLSAFEKHPNYKVPELTSPREDRIYELRSYESPTEKVFQNKVKMFNDGDEIGLFERLGFNAVFYGEVIAGCHMPNLMYMTTFDDKKSRDAHWKSFVDDPVWKELSADPQYQNNVSHIDIVFLRPAEYSDF